MFQVVASHCEHIFRLLTKLKCDLDEFEKAIFQGLIWHFEQIFGLWTSPKFHLIEAKKRLSYWLQDTGNSFSSS